MNSQTGQGVGRRRLLGAAAASAVAMTLLGQGRAVASVSAGEAEPLQLVRVTVSSPEQARLLDEFDLVCGQSHTGALEMVLWPGDAAKLQALGFTDVQVLVGDLVAADRAAGLQQPSSPVAGGVPGERTNYRRWGDFAADMNDLVKRFPDKARLFTLPEKTREGRDVVGIEICSEVVREDGRPVFYMDGIHHAREWPAAEMPIMFAFDLLESYSTDAQVRNVVDNVRTLIVPVVNPDGFVTSRDALIDVGLGGIGAYWRKNRRSVSGVTAPDQSNPDAYGVDPNRNYAFNWGGVGSSGNLTSETYRGDAPFSEPEARNVRHIFRTRSVVAMMTAHTYGNLILRPWSYTAQPPPDDAILSALGAAMATFNGYESKIGLGLYPSTGTTKDWAYGAYGTIGYTFEHGKDGFHPSYTGYVPPMYAKNRGAYLLLAEAATNPLYHGVITGRAVDAAGAPLAGATVRIGKEFQTPLWYHGDGSNPTGRKTVTETASTTLETHDDGSFTFHVNPSTQPLEAGAGNTESYVLTVLAGDRASAPREVAVRRGETAHIGDIAAT